VLLATSSCSGRGLQSWPRGACVRRRRQLCE
jgi:hypothetical protein